MHDSLQRVPHCQRELDIVHDIEKLFVFSRFDIYGANATSSSSKRHFTNQDNLKSAMKPDVTIAGGLRELLFVEHKGSDTTIEQDFAELLLLMKDAFGVWRWLIPVV